MMTSFVAIFVICSLPLLVSAQSASSACDQTFNSLQHKTATVTSPNYPNQYPAEVTCRYTFIGQSNERVQIVFLHFDLGQLHTLDGTSQNRECEVADSLRVTVYIEDMPKEINVYCGNTKPPMLMSSDSRMELTFTSRSTQSSSHGFLANYSFVTDFGIKFGEKNSNTTCGFVYKSERAMNGSFTSPNYPGLYPRNIECHYLFFGKDTDQQVIIVFPSIDVDGYMPKCEDDTQSDYVEFSNFNINLLDRKMSRLCGKNSHERHDIISDTNFFRVTFKSNDVYDSTGFKAFYQFRQIEEDPSNSGHKAPHKSSVASAASNRTERNCGAWLVAMTIMFAARHLSIASANVL